MAMHQQNRPHNCRDDSRRGSVLLVVLVVVALLSLGAYTFSETMVTERRASEMHGRAAHTRAFADSGIELVAAVLGAPAEDSSANFYHDPAQFQGVLMRSSQSARGTGRFSIVAPIETDPTAGGIRFGLMDEAGKLNVNAILKLELDEDEPPEDAAAADADSDATADSAATAEVEQREMLMYVPGMTEDLADAILDWVDEDDDPREYGAESDYYESLSPPYFAKNGPFESFDELLRVRGVDTFLLYGEDANRNGLLDRNENDGDLTPPFDNADGLLELGWNAYLTVYSRESNLRADGTEKIYVNTGDLATVYDDIEAEMGEDEARFVIAYRIYGPVQTEEDQRGTSSGGASGSGGRQSSDVEAVQAAAANVAKAVAGSGDSESVTTRGGIVTTQSAEYTIISLYDLIGVQVEAEVDGQMTTLESPWPADSGSMHSYLPTLMDTLATIDDPYIEGRINVNQARLEVLLGLPEMDSNLANAIVNSQQIDSSGAPLSDAIAARATTGWLVTDGLVDLPRMRRLDPYLTAGGSVFRVQSVGYFDVGGPYVRLEAIIDSTQLPPKIVFLRDLTELGRGYSSSLLSSGLQQP